MDSRLRQLAGIPPLVSAFGLGIRGGKIDVLTFPWLNIGWNTGPVEFDVFLTWLNAEHPEASPKTSERLFRTVAQEWILKLTPESLDLLAGYLERDERSVNGQR